MRITAIGTRVVNARMRNWVFVKVETDEGIWLSSTIGMSCADSTVW